MDENTGNIVMTTDILAMISPEGERVALTKGLKARGNVEDWLGKVEEAMFLSLKKLMKIAIREYVQKPRETWVTEHANQIILTVSQIMWARNVHEILDKKGGDKHAEMIAFESHCVTVSLRKFFLMILNGCLKCIDRFLTKTLLKL